jgi:chondroitin sulfate synthase
MKMFFLFRFQKMQHIFHHNSSGNNAYTGDLLSREVLRAISLHPIKISNYQYRLHNFMNLRQIIDLRQRSLLLKREVFKLKTEILNAELHSIENNTDTSMTPKATSTNANANELDNVEIYSDFENLILNKKENLSVEALSNRFFLPPLFQMLKTPKKREDRHDFDFFTRSLFSSTYISPKRGLEGYWKNSLVDTVRQIMEEINHNSIERGRIIDFKVSRV